MSFKENRAGIRKYLDIQRGMTGVAAPNSPDPNVRWGKRAPIQFLANSSANGTVSATMVSSPMYKDNVVFAFGVRFGDPHAPGAPLRPFIQAGTFGSGGDPSNNIAGVKITIIRSIDAKTGPVTDTVDLAEGESMPACELLARQITIAVTVEVADPTIDTIPWIIEITAAPVTSINCDSLTESGGWETVSIPLDHADPTPLLQGYKVLDSAAGIDSTPLQVQILPENPRRAQFSIINVGTIPIAIGFGPRLPSFEAGIPGFPTWGTTADGSFPYATLILPGITDFSKEFSRYESPIEGFTGQVWAVAQPGHGSTKGIICITEGTKPVL